jgi:hypothetical protein
LLPLPADKVVENKLFVFTIVIGDEPPVEPVEIVILPVSSPLRLLLF